MTKRLVEIDDDVLAAARRELETPTIRATVDRALRDAVATAARRRHVLRLQSGGLPDLGDDEVRAAAWR